ncbi:unnamed protein product, partial [Mesorhabditis belari]|uniref:C3HC-type domain-containing protein n=1 Tax=Mesorhabditis belari TaxID=2138241 RepID=A0AAF3FIA0_9BILA
MVEENEEQLLSTTTESPSKRFEATPTPTTNIERALSHKRKAQELLAQIRQATSPPVEQEQNKRRRRSENYMNGYKRRVATFTSLKWKAIPEISPRDFAEYGWVMKGSELVECASCSKIISTVLPDIKECLVATYIACVKHVREKLVNAHENICVFRSPSADYFSEFRDSIDSLKLFYRITFEELKRVDFGKYKYEDSAFKSLLTEIFGEISDAELPAASFAVLQWIPITKNPKKVECGLCARVCVPSILPTDTPPASQHYNWCPLLDFAADGSTPMWEELASYFKKFEKKKPLADAFRARARLSNTLSTSLTSLIAE